MKTYKDTWEKKKNEMGHHLDLCWCSEWIESTVGEKSLIFGVVELANDLFPLATNDLQCWRCPENIKTKQITPNHKLCKQTYMIHVNVMMLLTTALKAIFFLLEQKNCQKLDKRNSRNQYQNLRVGVVWVIYMTKNGLNTWPDWHVHN